MAYLPSARTIRVDLGTLGGPVTARCCDPANGTFTAIDGSPLANDGSARRARDQGCPDSLRRYCPAALNATICITQLPRPVTGADALYEPVAVTVRSSAMSPSGAVMMRLV